MGRKMHPVKGTGPCLLVQSCGIQDAAGSQHICHFRKVAWNTLVVVMGVQYCI